jgi:hypothetical protein
MCSGVKFAAIWRACLFPLFRLASLPKVQAPFFFELVTGQAEGFANHFEREREAFGLFGVSVEFVNQLLKAPVPPDARTRGRAMKLAAQPRKGKRRRVRVGH